MGIVILKLISIAIILLILCLPFFPARFRFSLRSAGYENKKSWRNLSFVLETAFLCLIFISAGPLLNDFLEWLFAADFMKWLTDWIPDRFVYTVEAAIILISNLSVYVLFLICKKCFRAVLDKYVFSDASGKNSAQTKKGSAKRKAPADSRGQNRSEKRMKQLRRDSLLVFGRSKKKTVFYAADGKKSTQVQTREETPGPQPAETEEKLSLKESIKKAYLYVIGWFYEKEDGYEYVTVRAYRWGNELKLFLYMVSGLYLVAALLMLLPAFFSFSDIPGFYSVSLWLVNNCYLYPMLSLILLFEILWFLDGESKAPQEAEAPFVSFVSKFKEKHPAELDKIRTVLLEKYGQSYRIKTFTTDEMSGKSTYRLDEKSRAVQNMAKAIRGNKGFVNGDYMQGIEYMLDGKHVLFDSSLYSSLGEYIVRYLHTTLSFGTRVLFICSDRSEIKKASAYLHEAFKKLTELPQVLWRICTFEQLHEGTKPDILLLTPEQFLDKSLFTDGERFFDELVDVFVLDTEKIITANNYYCLIMAKKLEKATSGSLHAQIPDADVPVAIEKRIRYSFLTNGSIQSLGNSIHQFFHLEDAPLETFHSFGLATKTDVFVWQTGDDATLYVDNGANQVALEVQIAKEVIGMGVPSVNLISQADIYSNQLNEMPGLTLNGCDPADSPVGYIIVADDQFNLPNTIYNFSRFSGQQSSVLHVVSKPYLLRDYFTDKAESYVTHFELIGKTMAEHADAKKAKIIILLCDAINGIERNAFIRRASQLLDDRFTAENAEGLTEPDLQTCIKLCHKAAFDTDADYEPQYFIEHKQNSALEYKDFVFIKESERLFEKLLEQTNTVRLKYNNTQKDERLSIFKDEICQHFIPGQILVRNNRAYTIKTIDAEAGVLRLDDTSPSVNVPMDYIQTRHYTVSEMTSRDTFGHRYRAKNSIVTRIGFEVYDATVRVDTVGYYSIEKAVQTVDLVKPNFAKYVSLVENDALTAMLARTVRTNMLVIELEMNEESDPGITYSLSVILQEFMKTAFPQDYRCISVCPLFDGDCEEDFFAGNTSIRDLYPRIVSIKSDDSADACYSRIRFAVIEDIEGGNGVIETLTDGNGIMVTNILHMVSDYLQWAASSAEKDRNYLYFGYGQCPNVFQFEKLEKIVRQFHHDVERSKLVRTEDQNTCFFCRRPLQAEKCHVLEDGRILCRNCAATTVATFEELNEVFDTVLKAIKDSTAAADSFPKDIGIDFVSTQELRERYGENAGTLPVAYCNHVTNRIYAEYGLPKTALIGAVSRLITELWQDHNLTTDGSPVYSGQPLYVELQTLTVLRFAEEASLLARHYDGHAGLHALRGVLAEKEMQDSFAYFLNVLPEERKKDESHGDGAEQEAEDDFSFVADRNPAELPRYLYAKLNDSEKAVYDKLYQTLSAREDTSGALPAPIGRDRCIAIVNMVLNDNPDIFWCANPPGAVSVGSDGTVNNVIFEYIMTPAEIKRRKKQIEKAIKPFLKGIKPSMSDYEVALRAHENIVSLIDYDSLGLEQQERDPNRDKKPDNLRSVYGVFVENKAVCAGYAKAFQYLLHRLGIECAYVIGPCRNGEWHAWNMLKLEGEYYYVDVTFDDRSNTDMRKNIKAEVSYDYFCITTEDLLKSRQIHEAELYPVCNAKKCNYFVKSRLFLKEYNAAHIGKIITSAVQSGKKEISFRTENAALLEAVKTRLVTNQGFFDILRGIEGKKLPSQYSYYCNEELNILHFILSE